MKVFNLISGWSQRQDEEPKLNSQFFLTLRSIYIGLKPETPDKVQSECLARIDELFHGVENWSSAYEIEQLMIHLYKPENMAIELERRLVEAQRILRPDEYAKYQRLVSETVDAPAKRIVLARMVNDIQWRHTINETRRKYIRITAGKSGLLFAFSVAVFALVYFKIIYIPDQLNLHAASVVAAASGFLGASFSMILGQRKRLESTSFDDLKVMRRFGSSIPRALVGLGAATILYYLMVCGLIGGLAFPTLADFDIRKNASEFSKVSRAAVYSAVGVNEDSANGDLTNAVNSFVTTVNSILAVQKFIPEAILSTEAAKIAALAIQSGSKQSQDALIGKILKNLRGIFDNSLGPSNVALLIFWCFLAGFSEQLVPKLLSNVESKLNLSVPHSGDRSGKEPLTPGLGFEAGAENPDSRNRKPDNSERNAILESGEPNDRSEVPAESLNSGVLDAANDSQPSQPVAPPAA